MKILHMPFTYRPDPVGGTEVYVESLVQELLRCGVENVIVAPGQTNCSYQYNNLTIRRFAVSEELNDLRELYGEGDLLAAREFASILDEEQPNIVHLHAFNTGVSIRQIRAAKQRNIKVVFTYHTPNMSCSRGTLIRWDKEVCDGRLKVQKCSACVLHARGASRRSATVLSLIPPVLGRTIGAARLSGGIWTALRMTELMQLQNYRFRTLMEEVDLVIALCQWTMDLLISNSVPERKIVLCRHGLPQTYPQAETDSPEQIRKPQASARLRVAFLGRLDYTKGPDILIRTMRALPELDCELDIYGIIQSSAERYPEELRKIAQGDTRIRFLSPVDNVHVVSLLREYDLLAVPSRFLETGPLVVLEAFAAGVPVLGSRRGGVAELIQDGINGLLIEPDSVAAWKEALLQCYESSTLLTQLRQQIRQPRGVKEVAQEMLKVYRRLIIESDICRNNSYF